MSPRLTIPRKTSREVLLPSPAQHTADLAGLACYCCSCVHASTCLLEAHARSSQTHKDCIVSSPRHSCHLPWSAQQSSLILPVFTNWPFSCSSNPDTRVFVRRQPRNSSLPAKHCCTVVAVLHDKAQHNTRRYAPNALHISHSTRGLSSGN